MRHTFLLVHPKKFISNLAAVIKSIGFSHIIALYKYSRLSIIGPSPSHSIWSDYEKVPDHRDRTKRRRLSDYERVPNYRSRTKKCWSHYVRVPSYERNALKMKKLMRLDYNFLMHEYVCPTNTVKKLLK